MADSEELLARHIPDVSVARCGLRAGGAMISNMPMQAQLINEVGNNLEPLITGLWEDVFGFSPIGLQDDFFELGGNSLHAARLVTKIRVLMGRDLPLESFLYAPTIERLALLMRAAIPSPLPLW